MALGAFLSRGKPDSYFVYKDSVKALLRDGGSAQFSNVIEYKSGWICGSVNSKNGFGGYAGARGFVVSPGGAAYVEDGSSIGNQVFNQMRDSSCRDVAIPIATTYEASPPGKDGKPQKPSVWPKPTTVPGYESQKK